MMLPGPFSCVLPIQVRFCLLLALPPLTGTIGSARKDDVASRKNHTPDPGSILLAKRKRRPLRERLSPVLLSR